jgi:hypothetical protein
MRAEVDMTAVVRALPGTPNLITGESVRLPNNAFQEQVRGKRCVLGFTLV